MEVRGISWMGVRTERFAAMRALLRDTMGLELVRDEHDTAGFRFPGGEELEIYAGDEPHHRFFGPGPVVGFEVDDFERARRALVAAGVELLTEPQHRDRRGWVHFRGPDGNVYEITGPDG
jgi:catechol 2,3-dioxygenase-like lactoylglutathione lyase family enzyme